MGMGPEHIPSGLYRNNTCIFFKFSIVFFEWMIFQIDSILMYIYILLRVIEIVMRFNIYINYRTYL